MSAIHWRGNHIFQSVGDNESELGHVNLDQNTGTYVLWLKDFDGDFVGNPDSYVRGDEWHTLQEAREEAAGSPTARLLHLKWMHSLRQTFGFLAMQFGDRQLEKLSTDHIKPAVKKSLGYDVVDMRDISEAGLIDQLMRNAIQKSKFVIADLTHGNNGAYWEAGFAEGKEIPVVYICEERIFEREKTHFDTNHLMTVTWFADRMDTFESDLVSTLRNSLQVKR